MGIKVLDLALKDLLRAFRGVMFWAFGLAIPLLVSGLFYFAFGGLAGGEEGLSIPATRVWVVNLDEGAPQAGGYSGGQVLVDVLRSESLSSFLAVVTSPDPAAARAAVDRQEAGVAVIIPAGFTVSSLSGGPAMVEVYQDPTLTLGPGIVKGIVRQVVDGLAGSLIAVDVADRQLAAQGLALDEASANQIAMEYAAWATALGQGAQQGTSPLLDVQPPAGRAQEGQDMMAGIISLIMAGMMVFFVFFTGAAMAQTILEEEEAGTLSRLFTTPTPHSAILGGKLLAAVAILAMQLAVLLAAAALIFGVDWGPLPAVVLTGLVLILLAASFGLFVTSLLKSTRQGGIVYGGVLTTMGMLGMISIFTAGVPGAGGETFARLALIVPQGWAVRAWQMLLAGGALPDLVGTLGVMLALAILFFILGLLRFRKRFA